MVRLLEGVFPALLSGPGGLAAPRDSTCPLPCELWTLLSRCCCESVRAGSVLLWDPWAGPPEGWGFQSTLMCSQGSKVTPTQPVWGSSGEVIPGKSQCGGLAALLPGETQSCQ